MSPPLPHTYRAYLNKQSMILKLNFSKHFVVSLAFAYHKTQFLNFKRYPSIYILAYDKKTWSDKPL